MGVVQPDWRTELMQVLPHFFASTPVPGSAAIACPNCMIECGAGWAEIVDRLCVRIAATLQDRERFRFVSIRQREGALRIVWGGRLSSASEAVVREAVDLAEARSVCVCELCGSRGRLYRADDIRTTPCPDHATGDRALRPEMENLHLRTVGRMRVLVASRYDFGTDSFVDIADDLPCSLMEP
jgi:hypothetical protein